MAGLHFNRLRLTLHLFEGGGGGLWSATSEHDMRRTPCPRMSRAGPSLGTRAFNFFRCSRRTAWRLSLAGTLLSAAVSDSLTGSSWSADEFVMSPGRPAVLSVHPPRGPCAMPPLGCDTRLCLHTPPPPAAYCPVRCWSVPPPAAAYCSVRCWSVPPPPAAYCSVRCWSVPPPPPRTAPCGVGLWCPAVLAGQSSPVPSNGGADCRWRSKGTDGVQQHDVTAASVCTLGKSVLTGHRFRSRCQARDWCAPGVHGTACCGVLGGAAGWDAMQRVLWRMRCLRRAVWRVLSQGCAGVGWRGIRACYTTYLCGGRARTACVRSCARCDDAVMAQMEAPCPSDALGTTPRN